MSWSPNPTVTIGAVDFTGVALETVRVTRGRREILGEPLPGYLICELIQLDGQPLNISLFDRVSFTINDSAGVPRTVFVGNVSDTSSQLVDAGFEAGTSTVVTTLIAVGPLARASTRRVAEDGFAGEKDGDRIARLIFDALAATWEESGGTWAQQVGTWNTFDQGLDANRIDQPGVFDIAGLDPVVGGYDAQGQAYLTAISALGVLWDDREGFIAYADADRRIATDQTDAYIDLPAAVIGSQGLNVNTQAGDISTEVVVNFDGGIVQVDDSGAILQFGRIARQFDLNLVDQTNAADWAERYLVGHSGPIAKLDRLPIRLDLIADDTLRDDLLTIDVNAGIRLSGIPEALGLEFRRTFVEGLDWNIDRERIGLSLSLTDAVLSINFQRWTSVTGTLRWEDVDATLEWQDATIVRP